MKHEKNKRKIIQRQLWNLMKNDSKIVEELDAVIGVSDDKGMDHSRPCQILQRSLKKNRQKNTITQAR